MAMITSRSEMSLTGRTEKRSKLSSERKASSSPDYSRAGAAQPGAAKATRSRHRAIVSTPESRSFLVAGEAGEDLVAAQRVPIEQRLHEARDLDPTLGHD